MTQEEIIRLMQKFSVTGRNFPSKEEISSHRRKFPVLEYLFKNCVIFLGEGGRSSNDYIGLQGGGLVSPKKDYVFF